MNRTILLLSIVLMLNGLQGKSQVTVNNLRCEYLDNPLGIDEARPRFTWQLTSEKSGMSQTAYQLSVGRDQQEVAGGQGNSWKSDIVESSVIPAVYEGPELLPFTRYFWSVRVLNDEGQWSDWSQPAFFETGIMYPSGWKGSWISDGNGFDGNSIQVKQAPYFRKEFRAGKAIRSARAYIAVAGLYELFINGERVGDHRLDPMYTRYDRRNLYVTYDVTAQIKRGENAIGVVLGNGWYNHQSTAVWFFDRAPWRNRPAFCLDVHITYEDGSTETIVTDKSWRTSFGPLVFNSIYTAEHYDARLENKGWSSPDFDDKQWKDVLNRAAPSRQITAQALHPIRHTQEIPAKEMKRINDRTWLFDFGRNIAGVTRIKVAGEEGTVIRLEHGERLDSIGRLDMSNIDLHYRPTDDSDPFQTDIFILSGKGEDEFMPRFNYKGFQYVEVTSDRPLELSKENLTAYFMHSDVPASGNIHSSNETLNKIWQAGNAAYLSNLFGYPTDCPQREKNGWTGDAHIAIETGLYSFDGITVYEKWLADHRDEQQPNGVLPSIIPSNGWGYEWGNGPDWTSTIAIIPWNIYLFYGDSRLLERCYDNIKRYVNHIDETYPSGLTDWGLGDWVPVKSQSPKEFTSSTYFYVDALILAKAAKIFGKQADFEKYSTLAGKIRKAINDKYLNNEMGVYGSGLQTEQSVALHWGLVPPGLEEKVAANLAKRVEADNRHIDVGLLGTKTILNALSENGYPQLAWEVASQETYPSWGWWIANGATTFYENWDIHAANDISMNHIMFGEINAWYYKGLGGIFPDEEHPGFKRVILKPNFVTGLDHFEASHEGPYGRIVSSWKKKGKVVEYKVSMPANSSALLYLNGKRITENNRALRENPLIEANQSGDGATVLALKAGEYVFEIR